QHANRKAPAIPAATQSPRQTVYPGAPKRSFERRELPFIPQGKSRVLLLAKQPSKAAQPTAQQLLAWLQLLPGALRQTITFDNGTEFALHHQLNTQLGMQTFFCDTHSPWQKGGVENAIGRMRRPLPRKTNLATIDADTL